MSGRGAVRVLLAAALAVAAGGPAAAQGEPSWVAVGYLQQSFPKQTTTNAQIEQINQAFGSDFDTWDDVVNLSLGLQLHRRLSETWLLGGELDFSRGAIDGSAEVMTEAGPATLSFEQSYAVFANLMVATRYLPCPSCTTWRPVLYGAAGVAYERDTTTLDLTNELLDEHLRVENDGFFPVATAGVAVDAHLFPDRTWFLELGAAYYWGRLEHTVAAEGSLAPSPEVTADTDSTGPNWWLGVGRHF